MPCRPFKISTSYNSKQARAKRSWRGFGSPSKVLIVSDQLMLKGKVIITFRVLFKIKHTFKIDFKSDIINNNLKVIKFYFFNFVALSINYYYLRLLIRIIIIIRIIKV